MTFRTIQFLEHVQWFGLHAAIATTLIVGTFVMLLALAAAGVNLVEW